MSIVQQQIRSMVAAPLQTDDRVIGLIYLDSPHFVHEFTKDDLNLLTVMANVAAIRIEHTRLAEVEQAERMHAKELEQAAEIQRKLLPITRRRFRAWIWRATMLRAAPSAAITSTSSVIRMAASRCWWAMWPEKACRLLCSCPACRPAFRFCSTIPAIWPRWSRASIASSNPTAPAIDSSVFHRRTRSQDRRTELRQRRTQSAAVARHDGTVERLDCTGLILGIMPAARYEQQSVTLQPGEPWCCLATA